MKNNVTPDPVTRTDIRKAAFRLFRTVGYKSTSYSMIAEESGQGRPLVQYYYPKKEQFALEFILEALQIINDLLTGSDCDSTDPAVHTTRLGQIYYGFLLYDDAMRTFTKELLAKRDISSQIVSINAEESLPGIVDEPDAERMKNASIQATGGVYELLYLSLLAGVVMSPGECSVKNTAAFLAFTNGVPYEEAGSALERELLEGTVLEDIEKKLFRLLLE